MNVPLPSLDESSLRAAFAMVPPDDLALLPIDGRLAVKEVRFLGLPPARLRGNVVLAPTFAASRVESGHVVVFLGTIHAAKGISVRWPSHEDLPTRRPRALHVLMEGVDAAKAPVKTRREVAREVIKSFAPDGGPCRVHFADAFYDDLVMGAEAVARGGGPPARIAALDALYGGAAFAQGDDPRLRAATQALLLGPVRHRRLVEALDRILAQRRPSTVVIPWGALHAEPIWTDILEPRGFLLDTLFYTPRARFHASVVRRIHELVQTALAPLPPSP